MSGFTHERRDTDESIEWYTPPHIFDAIALRFDLDPCSAGEGNDSVPADTRYTIHDDGLTMPWHGLVWMNPPYGSHTSKWMKKLSEHGDGIALVFARTGTRWWHDYAHTAHTICFVKGRIRFINGKTGQVSSTSGADSALIAWGEKAGNALLQSGLGMCVTPTRKNND